MKRVHKNTKQLTLVNCNVFLNSSRGSAQKMQPDLSAVVSLYKFIRISYLVKYVRIVCEIALENAFVIRVCRGEQSTTRYLSKHKIDKNNKHMCLILNKY